MPGLAEVALSRCSGAASDDDAAGGGEVGTVAATEWCAAYRGPPVREGEEVEEAAGVEAVEVVAEEEWVWVVLLLVVVPEKSG